MTKAIPVWNYTKLLTELGSNRAVMAAIRGQGYKSPPLKTVAGWRVRNSIPGKWAPLMIQIWIERGLIKDVEDLLQTPPRQKIRIAVSREYVPGEPLNLKPEWKDL